MLKRLLPLAVVMAAAFALAVQDTKIDLKLNVKKDQTFTYKSSVATDFQGTPISVTGKVISTVVSVDDKTVVWKNESRENTIDAGGMSDTTPDSTSTMTQAKSGQILKLESEMESEDSNRISAVFGLYYPTTPVSVGSKWTITVPADKNLGTFELTSTYEAKELKKVDGKDALVLNFRNEEKTDEGIVAEGTMVVDVATGMLISVDAKFSNIPQMGLTFAGTYKVELVK